MGSEMCIRDSCIENVQLVLCRHQLELYPTRSANCYAAEVTCARSCHQIRGAVYRNADRLPRPACTDWTIQLLQHRINRVQIRVPISCARHPVCAAAKSTCRGYVHRAVTCAQSARMSNTIFHRRSDGIAAELPCHSSDTSKS